MALASSIAHMLESVDAVAFEHDIAYVNDEMKIHVSTAACYQLASLLMCSCSSASMKGKGCRQSMRHVFGETDAGSEYEL